MNESLQTIAEHLGLTLRVSADGSEIVIRRDGAELWRTDRQREATAFDLNSVPGGGLWRRDGSPWWSGARGAGGRAACA